MNINNNKVKEAAKAYVLECIDLTGYPEVKADTEAEKVGFVVKEFNSIACYPYNMQLFNNNYMRIFIDFLKGMPSFLSIETDYSEIRKILKSFGADKLEKNGDDEVERKFFELIYFAFYDLLLKHGLTIKTKY